MEERIIDRKKTFGQLPPQKMVNLNPSIIHELRQKFDVVIVLDDDPTGTQTVYNIPVLTTWSVDDLRKEFIAQTPFFYILTNSRSLDQKDAKQLALTIGHNIKTANQGFGKKYLVVSRGDSTLRGHYPSEVEALKIGLGASQAINILIPAFFEGGRFTIEDIHYVGQGEQLIPAAKTPYAQDHTFGFANSNMKSWVEEKTRGAVHASEVATFSIEDLRTKGLEYLIQKLNGLKPNSTCIVNAVNYQDLQIFTLALLNAEIQPICRTAASFVAALAAQPDKPLLQKETLIATGNNYGGLIIIGSYVPKTTQQLQHLQHNTSINAIELNIHSLLNAENEVLSTLTQYADQINDLIQKGEDVALYTSRDLVLANNPAENLLVGKKISSFITFIINQLQHKPKYILSKGGITSSDIATKSLNVKRAVVMGQILAGVPVWRLQDESKFPGLSYIIFPGNVGEEDSVTHVVEMLK